MAQFYSAKRRVTTRQIITVTVNDLDPFGQGVARHQGKALFVSGVLPHEQAEVALVEDKKQYARRGETPTDRQPAAPGAALPPFWRLRRMPTTTCQRSASAAK
jgi:predicted RNA-binding protein with TRAM domain